MEDLAVQGTPEAKVSVDTRVFQDCPPPRFHPTFWRRESPGTTVVRVSPASLDPEVTRVSPDSLEVRVGPDLLVTPSRAKVSLEYPVTLGNREPRATREPRVRPAFPGSLEPLDQGVMMVDLVSLATLENLVVLVLKV